MSGWSKDHAASGDLHHIRHKARCTAMHSMIAVIHQRRNVLLMLAAGAVQGQLVDTCCCDSACRLLAHAVRPSSHVHERGIVSGDHIQAGHHSPCSDICAPGLRWLASADLGLHPDLSSTADVQPAAAQ